MVEVLPFHPSRRRMSVVVRGAHTGRLLLLCKGADCSVLPLLRRSRCSKEEEAVRGVREGLEQYSRRGLRSLVMAGREVGEEEYRAWREDHQVLEEGGRGEEELRESYSRLEVEMMILGATGVEDRLQEGVVSSLALLREAGLPVWVVTGDMVETTVSVATSCALLTPDTLMLSLTCTSREEVAGALELCREQASSSDDKALVVDGQTLELVLASDSPLFEALARQCGVMLACRVSPLQKAQLARLAEDRGKLSLAIGDGANDVSMLQAASVGVGVCGQEGSQAVRASDFSLPSFRHLARLLLVHSHWNYSRLVSLALHSFYKNAVFVFVLFWFQLHCGFSGQDIIDNVSLILFSVFYTSLPPLVLGVFERDETQEKLYRHPGLYPHLSRSYTPLSFWLVMVEALYHSLLLFYLPYFWGLATPLDLWQLGSGVCLATILVIMQQLAVEVRSWTVMHVASVLLSVSLYLAVTLVTASVSLATSSPFMTSPNQWAVLVLTLALAPIPRLACRALAGTLGAGGREGVRRDSLTCIPLLTGGP